MSEQFSLTAEERTVIGKQVKQLRREDKIPAIIYGQSTPITIQINGREARQVLRRADQNSLFNIQLASGVKTALIRDIQKHLTRGDLLHIDFYEVNMRETITAVAELVRAGMADLVEQGLGMVNLSIREVEIEARPGDLISEIEVDMSLIKTDEDVIYVSDLVAPPNVTILTDPETVVASFEYIREEEVEEELEVELAPDSVEVITREDEEEEI